MKEGAVFVCPHGIGDLLMSTPTIGEMRNAGFAVSVLVKGDLERSLLREIFDSGDVACACLSEFKGGRAKRLVGAARWIAVQRARYVFAQYGVDPAQFAILAWLSRAPVRVGWGGRFAFLNSAWLHPKGQHKVLETARYLTFLGIESSVERLRGPQIKRYGVQSSNRVVLAPGSGEVESHKRWPAKKFGQLARLLNQAYGCEVEVVGGPDEVSLCDSVVEEAACQEAYSTAGCKAIGETLKALGRASVVVANCNGVSHVAAAVGAPVVGLYGPTDPKHTGPFTTELTTVSIGMECSPCYRRGFIRGCGNPVCMRDIEVEAVFDAVSRKLDPGSSVVSNGDPRPGVGVD